MSVLSEILANKRREVEIARRRVPLSELKRRLQNSPPPRDFIGAIRNSEPPALIAEIKKASPSGGILREDIAPEAIAKAYEENGAAAISVLTEGTYFLGSLEHLSLARSAVSLPVMQKDFILDEYQLYEGRVAGADAVLLIVAALQPDELRYLLSVAWGLGMAAFVEVHNEEEIRVAVDSGARLIGINNRDLHVFRTDLGVTLRLMPLVPSDRLVISESGIKTRRDVLKLKEAGVAGILVGESIMRTPDVGAKVRELLGRDSA